MKHYFTKHLLIVFFFVTSSSLIFSQAQNQTDMETSNQQLITKFYSSFQKKDYKGMQECYADTATFSDEVFVNLNSEQVKAMWEMLCIRGTDLVLDFKNVTAKGNQAGAEWEAHYTFSASKRKVVNRIKASFIIENGKIVKHTDVFDFYKWSKQALGFPGALLGWTGFFKNTVRKGAMKSLNDFMSKKAASSN
ncbi:MAG: nuclear transport factor 2 family protein [Bacteroidia bacterium]|jgi:ketosteroid isomerase-like protein